MESDNELYQRFLSGETAAYDQLLILHGDHLVYFINGYVHNLQDSEDLMIEAFARIMAKRPSIQEGCFKAYLFKTARNLAARFHSVFRRLGEFSFEEMPDESFGEDSFIDGLLDDDRKRALHKCLSRISPDAREALWLYYFEDMSYLDAAMVMGVNTKKVDHLLSKGKKQLAAELKKEGITHAYE